MTKKEKRITPWLFPFLIVLFVLMIIVSSNSSLSIWAVLIPFIVLYFLPGIIAFSKRRKNKVAILILNILLGWTLIVWVVALIWSLCND